MSSHDFIKKKCVTFTNELNSKVFTRGLLLCTKASYIKFTVHNASTFVHLHDNLPEYFIESILMKCDVYKSDYNIDQVLLLSYKKSCDKFAGYHLLRLGDGHEYLFSYTIDGTDNIVFIVYFYSLFSRMEYITIIDLLTINVKFSMNVDAELYLEFKRKDRKIPLYCYIWNDTDIKFCSGIQDISCITSDPKIELVDENTIPVGKIREINEFYTFYNIPFENIKKRNKDYLSDVSRYVSDNLVYAFQSSATFDIDKKWFTAHAFCIELRELYSKNKKPINFDIIY